MLNQLQDLGRCCFGASLEYGEHSGSGWTPRVPAEVLERAERWCRFACTVTAPASPSLAQQGALALMHYVAALPPDVRDSIEPLPEFRDDIRKAWHEPCADTYVSLCNTVQDVWAHCVGPEAATNDAILRELLHAPMATALDFGAGAGHYAVGLAQHGVDVDAVDIDAVKTSFLAFRAARAGVSHRVRVGLRHSYYDAVLSIDVLDHLQDPSAVLRALVNRVAPGGRLYSLACFPDDGWHQCEPSAIAACADLLWNNLEPVAPIIAQVPWLDVFMKPVAADNAVGDPVEAPRPRLHPRAQFLQDEASGHWLIAAPTFYSGSCVVDDETQAFCRTLDGSRSIDDLRRHTDYDVDEIKELCGLLHGQRLLHWSRTGAEVARGT